VIECSNITRMNETSQANNRATKHLRSARSPRFNQWKESRDVVILYLVSIIQEAIGENAYNDYLTLPSGYRRHPETVLSLSQHLTKRYRESDESVEMDAETVFDHACEWARAFKYDARDKGFIAFLILMAEMPQKHIPRLYETDDLEKASRLIISGVPVDKVMDHESLNRHQATDSPVE
jgi:hypothetical protein